ncbi:MAG: hypothetical protein QM804_16770 [Propionicimonas sp.]
MTALALVESPVQLLHVIEWCHATGSADRTSIAVLAPGDSTSRRQLRAMLDYAEEEGIATRWCDPRRQGPAALVGTLAGLRSALRAADRLVVGDPFSGLIQLLLPAYRGDRLVVVDDGTATMEFTTRLAEGSPLLRWDAPPGLATRLRHPAARRAHRIFSPSPGRPVTVFTVMPASRVPGLLIHPNHYDWARGRFGRPSVVPGTDIVGTSLVESGVVAVDAYLDQVAALAAGGSGRYYAHRREADDKLARIAERTGLQVVRPRVPLELELRRGPVAERVVGFPSSVGYTLPVVLAGVGTRVELLPVEPAWLAPGIGAGTRQFLASIAAKQPVSVGRRSAARR